MQKLIESAVEFFLESFIVKIKSGMIRLIMTLIEFVSKGMLNVFDEPITIDLINMGIAIGHILFACTILILMIDIAEEAGSMKNDQFKAVEWPTILMNLAKAAVFVEAAPRLAIMSLYLVVDSVNSFDPEPYLNNLPNAPEIFGLIVIIIAVGGFCIVTMMRSCSILIQAFTTFLYVPDIVRGHTTSMGNWIRQTIAILLTFFLQYVMFFQGLVAYFNFQYIIAITLWIGMMNVSKFLDKYGMSSGVTSVLSTGASVAQGATKAVTTLAGG